MTHAPAFILNAVAMSITLDQILSATRRRVEQAKRSADLRTLESRAQQHKPRGFRAALEKGRPGSPAVIAELKKASPSRGPIRGTFQVGGLATQLQAAGAVALSVLTEEEFFQGSLDHLREASAATRIPCLRKDFILDEFQLLEARAHSADAVLLIVAALTDAELLRLYTRARELALDVLCEVHDQAELKRALQLRSPIIGVNSRNLKTFQVDPETPLRLAPQFPAETLRVAESGIASGQDIQRLQQAGYHAFLIGESLMRADSPGQALRQMLAEAVAAGDLAAQPARY
jgi:indole-3-glycerol phosphate synthase